MKSAMAADSVNARVKLTALVSLLLASFCVSMAANAQTDYSMINARDTVHINNCGSCHLPYSPGLLPMPSWSGIMAGLGNHFGKEVELSDEISKHILSYLEKYALTEGQQTIMGKLAADLPNKPSLRITELPAFVRMHAAAAEAMALDKFAKGSISTCDSCHRAAASHIFDKALLQVGTGDGPLSDYK